METQQNSVCTWTTHFSLRNMNFLFTSYWSNMFTTNYLWQLVLQHKSLQFHLCNVTLISKKTIGYTHQVCCNRKGEIQDPMTNMRKWITPKVILLCKISHMTTCLLYYFSHYGEMPKLSPLTTHLHKRLSYLSVPLASIVYVACSLPPPTFQPLPRQNW